MPDLTAQETAAESAYGFALECVAMGLGYADTGREIQARWGGWLNPGTIRETIREAYVDARMQGVEHEDIAPSMHRAHKGWTNPR